MTKRRSRLRRARVAVGVAGLATVLGGAAYVTTSTVLSDGSTTATDPTGPQIPAASFTAMPAESPSEDAVSRGSGSAAMVPTVDISGKPVPSKIVEDVRKAREKMAKDGVKVQRPAARTSAATPIKDEDVEQSTTGKIAEGGTVRVIAARGDMTGQRELSWVAGGITKHRGVDCSQTFKFAQSPTPVKKDNLLICWRTSPKKSVAALVADMHGKPSKDRAVKALERKWRSMD
jgi:hypothetical protein